MPIISKEEFRERVKQCLSQQIPSVTGRALYEPIGLQGNLLSFKRVNTGKQWVLDIDKLYNIYRHHDFIDTALVKRITKGRVNSPMVAVLLATKSIDADGYRL
jgi:hypothetical protein